MKIVSVWNPKGGQGKSTVSIHLAGCAHSLNLKTLIIDRDQQGTSMLFYNEGNLPFEVLPDYPKSAPDVDIIFIDHMAADIVIPDSPILVMPFLPIRSQYSHYLDNYKKAKQANKKIISVITKTDTRKKDQNDIVETVKKQGVFEIKDNVNIESADSQYRTIFDPTFDKGSNIERARGQVSAVLTSVLQNFENI